MRPTVALVLLGLTLPLARAIKGKCGAHNGGECLSCTREDGSCTVDEDCVGSPRLKGGGGCRCENPWEGPVGYQPNNTECRCNWNSEEGKCEDSALGIVVVLVILVLGGVILGLWFCRSQGCFKKESLEATGDAQRRVPQEAL